MSESLVAVSSTWEVNRIKWVLWKKNTKTKSCTDRTTSNITIHETRSNSKWIDIHQNQIQWARASSDDTIFIKYMVYWFLYETNPRRWSTISWYPISEVSTITLRTLSSKHLHINSQRHLTAAWVTILVAEFFTFWGAKSKDRLRFMMVTIAWWLERFLSTSTSCWVLSAISEGTILSSPP